MVNMTTITITLVPAVTDKIRASSHACTPCSDVQNWWLKVSSARNDEVLTCCGQS